MGKNKLKKGCSDLPPIEKGGECMDIAPAFMDRKSNISNKLKIWKTSGVIGKKMYKRLKKWNECGLIFSVGVEWRQGWERWRIEVCFYNEISFPGKKLKR